MMQDDHGFAMILVVGLGAVLMLLSVVVVAVVRNSLSSASGHARFESALDVAETGLDDTLAKVQKDPLYSNCVCSELYTFSNELSERANAGTRLRSLAASGTGLETVTGGQYIAIRPGPPRTQCPGSEGCNADRVYAMSWAPSYAAWIAHAPNSKSRLLKNEYIFGPYAPGQAILTQGNLNLSGSVLVNAATGTSAGVHTNGTLTSSSASLTVTGDLTSSGAYNVNGNATVGSGSGGATPLQDVPVPDPNYLYGTLQESFGGTVNVVTGNYTGAWYDLCDDGKARARDNTNSTPCTGTVLATASGSTRFRGWNFAASGSGPPTWTMNESSKPYDGIYYVYGADAVINGKTRNGDPAWHASVLAEPKLGSTACSKTGGNIEWKLTDIANYIPGIVLLAGADLTDAANNSAGNGLFGAADQVYMHTSSADVTGYIIAGDQCPDSSKPSEIQGITLHFDSSAESPIKSLIRTTLWLEYVGS